VSRKALNAAASLLPAVTVAVTVTVIVFVIAVRDRSP
jgi:hypothetical protein